MRMGRNHGQSIEFHVHSSLLHVKVISLKTPYYTFLTEPRGPRCLVDWEFTHGTDDFGMNSIFHYEVCQAPNPPISLKRGCLGSLRAQDVE